ncbi:DUF3466 family protein [Kangiella marina]|uniref:DUF3466 family protein n=1 Tax=Kangiella marina TaxID=1079178 RepID=A0ABP8IBX9_9GAMM
MKLTTTKTLLALSFAALTPITLAAPYDVVDLGGLGGNSSVAYDLNTAGQAVGFASGPLDENGERTFIAHAVQFDESGNIDLGTLTDGTISEAIGINDAMVAVGYSNEISTVEDDNGNEQVVTQNYAVIFEGSSIAKLPSLERLTNARAFDINNNNLVILSGSYDVDPDDEILAVERAFVFNRNDNSYTMIEPFDAGASRRSYLTSISDNNQVVGFTDVIVDNTTSVKGFVANTNDLSNLTELPSIDNRALYPMGLNLAGEVVGSIFIPGTGDQREAFYIDSGNSQTEPTLLGFIREDYNDSRANDINDNGQIVGRALVSTPTLGEFGAFIYEGEQMKDLNTLIACDSGWKLTEAVSINNSGQILGFGAKDGEVRAFRLDPTGEPVEDCGNSDEPNSGGGSVPALLLAILAAVGLRRRFS